MTAGQRGVLIGAVVAVLLVGAVLVGALATGDDDDGEVGTGPSTSSTSSAPSTSVPASSATAPPTTAAPATTAAPTTTAPGCPPTDVEPPPTSTGAPRGDLDGDGREDTVQFGEEGGGLVAVLADGRVYAAATGTARPYVVLGIVDADGDGADEVFITRDVSIEGGDRTTGVAVVHLADCAFAPVANAEGEEYTFVIGGGDGASDGMGCTDVDGDGRSELVGLHGERHGHEVEWTRTVVELEGRQARNGAVDGGTFDTRDDADAIELLGRATCGEDPLEGTYGA